MLTDMDDFDIEDPPFHDYHSESTQDLVPRRSDDVKFVDEFSQGYSQKWQRFLYQRT